MGAAAVVIKRSERVEEHHGISIPHDECDVFTDDPRAWVVKQTRELADRFERGEIRGYRIEFTDQMNVPGFVDMPYAVQVQVSNFERLPSGKRRSVATLTRFTFRPSSAAPKPYPV